MSSTPSEEFDPFASEADLEAQLPQVIRRLEIVTRRRVESLFAGAYQAVFQGQGMIFSDVRPYQPGDEVRWIDWNVSARMDELYIKQFVEERERTVMLVWDASRSMQLGQHRRSKRELCAELAMLLALSAIQNGDRVGLIIFSDKVERYIAPKRGRKHVMRMIQILLRFQPNPQHNETHLKDALLFLNRVSPRHTIAFILSDFLTSHENEEGVWQLLARQCECIPIRLTAPIEQDLASFHPNPLSIPNNHSFAEQVTGWTGTIILSTLLLVIGFWQGGNWLWSGGVAAFLCVLVKFVLHEHNPNGMYHLHDLESDTLYTMDFHDAKRKKNYKEQAQKQHKNVKERFRRLQIGQLDLSVEEDYLPTLLAFFRQRQRQHH